ncbi:miscellaneous; hypothetical/global homology [Collimonas arenae]|uniref:Miscellaneous hypothetical/global homology n=1 Tax=Collimonas arenae TaxID=279058 RepID=A0A0A1FCM2_9BURK|nr:DUF2846 domain-containing protein [Collimonas arenae]AIY41530.1 miscellaneous; hypothetical/global homology [Collimonas arenae]
MIKLSRPLFVAAALAVLLSGCAASGAKYSDMASSIPTLKADQGRIYFFRSSSMMGAAIQPEVRLNQTVVGKSQPGGFFYVDRPAGQYVAASSTEVEKTLSFALDAGETKYVRTSVSMGLLAGHVNPTLETQEIATKELPSLSFTGDTAAAK